MTFPSLISNHLIRNEGKLSKIDDRWLQYEVITMLSLAKKKKKGFIRGQWKMSFNQNQDKKNLPLDL